MTKESELFPFLKEIIFKKTIKELIIYYEVTSLHFLFYKSFPVLHVIVQS